MLETGSILEGRYVVLSEIRRGPTNVAYLGHLKNLPARRVAIKVVTLDLPAAKLQQAFERFRSEAERCAGIDHPNLAKVQDFFVLDDTAYVVDDYVEGRSVQDILQEQGHGLSLEVGMRIVRQLCDAIEYCHGLTPPVIVHAVQPPKLIMMANDQIKIVDAGQSWADNPGSRTTDYLNGIGSHGYSPIERYVAEHTVDRLSDLYALGATIYTLFSGLVPPAAVELITGQVKMEPLDSLNAEVPSALGDLVTKAMATQKSGRFQSVAEIRAVLANLGPPRRILPPPVVAKPVAPPPPEPPPLAAPSTGAPPVASPPPSSPEGELKVRRRLERPTSTPAMHSAAAETKGGDLAVRRAPPPAAAPARPAAPAPKAPWVAPTMADLPEQLRSGVPPVTATLELEGQPVHLFGPKEIERVAVDVLSIGPDSLKFGSRRTFKKGAELKLHLGVPLLVTGQSLPSEARVTIQTLEEQSSGLWHYTGTLEVPPRLRPILYSLHEQERRVARRFRSGFRVLSKMLKSYQASASDISATGFGFVSDSSFPVGDVHEFALDIDDAMQNAGGLKIQGKVVHCVPRSEGGFRVGVHFVNLNEEVARPLYHYLRTFHR